MSHKEERAPIRNPKRRPGERTEEELEVVRLAQSGEPQRVEMFNTKTYQYWAPFNYPNITVELGREDMGGEFNSDGVELDVPPYGAITIVQEEPIVGVTVIGSACVPPGFVILHAEPLEWKYPRTGIKMKVDGLWGQHVLGTMWRKGVDEGWREAGLSSAHFDLPESQKVTIMGGSQLDVGVDLRSDQPGPDRMHDAHYCFRIIRVTVREA